MVVLDRTMLTTFRALRNRPWARSWKMPTSNSLRSFTDAGRTTAPQCQSEHSNTGTDVETAVIGGGRIARSVGQSTMSRAVVNCSCSRSTSPIARSWPSLALLAAPFRRRTSSCKANSSAVVSLRFPFGHMPGLHTGRRPLETCTHSISDSAIHARHALVRRHW